MSETSQPTDFSDLLTDLLNRVRADTGGAASIVQAKRYVNIGLQDMHIGFGEKFPWAERSAELITQPEYTTGTLTATQGSASITGSGTDWNANNAFGANNMRGGGKIVIDGGVEVYEIDAVGGATTANLTAKFVQATTVGASYSYFEDEYSLSADFLRPLSFTSFDINDEILLIDRNEFRRRFPRNKVTGKPQAAAIFTRDFSGSTVPVRKVRFWKPPNVAGLIRYPFITNKLAVASDGTLQTSLSADSDEPIVPLQFRQAIVLHALYHWYRDKRDDDRSDKAKAEYTDLMLRITGDAEIGRPRPKFQPRNSPYVSAARSPYRGRRSGRFTVGSRFDEIR